MTNEDDRPARSAPDLGAASDVTVDPERATDAPEPGAWNAPTTADPDAMQGTPDELGGSGGEKRRRGRLSQRRTRAGRPPHRR